MEKETNVEIDKLFSQFGQIIRKTWFSTYKGNRQPNGNRSLVMQINEGMNGHLKKINVYRNNQQPERKNQGLL